MKKSLSEQEVSEWTERVAISESIIYGVKQIASEKHNKELIRLSQTFAGWIRLDFAQSNCSLMFQHFLSISIDIGRLKQSVERQFDVHLDKESIDEIVQAEMPLYVRAKRIYDGFIFSNEPLLLSTPDHD
jgi:hypothetical protein